MDRRSKSYARHKMKSWFFLPVVAFSLASCATKVTPEEAIAIANSYADVAWNPEQRHIRHGWDARRIVVHTPDTTLAEHGDDRGWWKPGVRAIGMPYKWGGFDTPESFLAGLKVGKKAGDVANPYKMERDNAAVSESAVGIDCSGFVSRCWMLTKHVSTKDMPEICDPIAWDELQPGDILLKRGHVVLFLARHGNHIIGYEAAPVPSWRVRRAYIPISYLKKMEFSPWRYCEMKEPENKTALLLRFKIESSGVCWSPVD